MSSSFQKEYNGWTLPAVPVEEMQGLKVVETDGDLGVVTNVCVMSEKDNPNRTIYITILWKNKLLETRYHWDCGWIMVGEKPEMARKKPGPYIAPPVVAKLNWFARLRKTVGV